MEKTRILAKLGIDDLNAMQQEAVEAIAHSDKDVLILSPTGSGKTLAYLLPLAERIDAGSDELQAVVIVPGRELALQSATVLKDMGCGLRGMALYGGRPTMDEHRKLREVKPHIVFATPGRLNDHFDKQNLSAEAVRWVVIDEFDKCLSMGFHDEMQRALAFIEHSTQNMEHSGRLRRVLLSATESEAIPRFVNMGRCVRINFLDEQEQVPERVTIYEVKSPTKDKLETLSRLLRYIGQESSIVFLNYRDSVERTADYLRQQGFTLSMFHGGLDQREREAALYRFSNHSANIMVCTDLASRGLDIPDIRHIIHYHIPEGEDGYVHRVGRTARWDQTGTAYFILSDGEQIPAYVDASPEELSLPAQLPQPCQPRMATIYIGKGKRDKISKGDVVGFLCKIAQLTKDDIGRIDVNERYTYVAVARERVAQTIKLSSGNKIKGVKTVVELVK